MDESWRLRTWMPHRRSTTMNHPDDFSDVFGGPPKSVLLRQSFGELDHTQVGFYYDKMFRPPEFASPANNAARSLSVFRIPTRDKEFYNDIFGSDRERQPSRQNSKGKSKSDSTSVLSSEEASPFWHVTRDDNVSSSFADMLRPINNIPTKWNSSKMKPEEHHEKHGIMSFFSFNHSPSMENQYIDNEINEGFRRSYSGLPRTVPSPETISLEPTSYSSVKVSVDDLEPNSPSSAISSLCHELRAKSDIQISMVAEEDDEVMSSYVINIGCDDRTTPDKIGTIRRRLAWPVHKDNRVETNEAIELDEVIAWVKEKFNSQTSETDLSTRLNETEGQSGSCEILGEQLGVHDIKQSAGVEERICSPEEEKTESENDMEMKDIDEDMKLWSSGKRTDIRLLLSTLHHILWPRSGWHVTPLASLKEGTQVKRAYQKARLCLHPDKLQQRGATNIQKYAAEKTFAILQEAWTAFISQDTFF